MKVTAERKRENKFEPITLTIVIQSRKEFDTLKAVFNISHMDMYKITNERTELWNEINLDLWQNLDDYEN